MRSYPTDSPQAAARIVALAMLADGHLSKAELETLDRHGAAEALGLTRTQLHEVLHGFCEDLLCAAQMQWSDACHIDPRTLAQLMAEIEDPDLRLKVLDLCVSIVDADDHLADGESVVLCAAVEQWGLHREMFEARLAA